MSGSATHMKTAGRMAAAALAAALLLPGVASGQQSEESPLTEEERIERLERRIEELETTQTAQEDATRTIIRDTISTLGSKINQFVTLGGTFELATGWQEFIGDPVDGSPGGSDRLIQLNTAELDFEIQVNDWTLGSVIIAYDDGANNVFSTIDERLVSVDRINVDTAFLTIGDTKRFPAFGQFGRMIVPFGISTGAPVADVPTLTSPLTLDAFETKEDGFLVGIEFPTAPLQQLNPIPSPPPVRPLLLAPLIGKVARDLGYKPYPRRPPPPSFVTPAPEPPPFTAGVYFYDGATFSRSSRQDWNMTRHFGATAGYRDKLNCRHSGSEELIGAPLRVRLLQLFCPVKWDIDVDFNRSVFESIFLQEEYRPFLSQIKFVPGMAAHLKASLGPVSLVAEWNGALSRARFIDHDNRVIRMRPSAWQITGTYQFDWNPWVESIGLQGTYVAVSYSESEDLEGVTRVAGMTNAMRVGAVPERRFLFTVGEYVLDGVRVAVEYSRSDDYGHSERGTNTTAHGIQTMLTYEW